MCYLKGNIITIAGNGSGKIFANEDSSYIFGKVASTDGEVSFLFYDSGLELLDTSKTTDMSYAFYDAYLNSQSSPSFSKFDTSNVTNMKGMFNNTRASYLYLGENFGQSYNISDDIFEKPSFRNIYGANDALKNKFPNINFK